MIASSAAFQQVAARVAVHRVRRRALRLRREQRLAPGARHAPRRTAPEHPRPRAPDPARADAATDRRSGRQARGQERAAVPRGRAVQHHPLALRAQRRHVARGPHLARHVPGRRQRDRGPDPAADRRPVRHQGGPDRPRHLGRRQRRDVAVPGAGERVAHRGRSRHEGRHAADLRGDRQPAEGGHAPPDRRHALLREGRLPAGPHRRRPQDRLAVQHLQVQGPAPRPRSRP